MATRRKVKRGKVARKTGNLDDGAFFELQGHVYFMERTNGVEVRTEIDGETVLKVILSIVSEHARETLNAIRG